MQSLQFMQIVTRYVFYVSRMAQLFHHQTALASIGANYAACRPEIALATGT